MELQLQMMAQGFAAQERMEEIRTDQIAMETDAQMTVAAYDHDKKIMEEASRWGNGVPAVSPIRRSLAPACLLALLRPTYPPRDLPHPSQVRESGMAAGSP